MTDLLAGTEFKAFRGVVDGGGVVRGLAVPGALEFSRKDFDDLVEFAKGWGGKGVAWLQLRPVARSARRSPSSSRRPSWTAIVERSARPRATPSSWWPTRRRPRCACWGRCACTWASGWA